jgi:hypothetical protein
MEIRENNIQLQRNEIIARSRIPCGFFSLSLSCRDIEAAKVLAVKYFGEILVATIMSA